MDDMPNGFDERSLSEIIERHLSKCFDEIKFSKITEEALPKYLDERKVSKITGRGLQTLRNDRHRRRGIPYSKVGRQVKYSLADVIEFMESRKIVPEDNMYTA